MSLEAALILGYVILFVGCILIGIVCGEASHKTQLFGLLGTLGAMLMLAGGLFLGYGIWAPRLNDKNIIEIRGKTYKCVEVERKVTEEWVEKGVKANG